MTPDTDFNELISVNVRQRLNRQKNKVKLEGKLDETGRISQPYIYVIGLGERHFKIFDQEIQRLCVEYQWLKKKHFRFIMNELIINSQFSMLREVVNNVPRGKRSPGYFFVKIYLCDAFVSVNIEEFGDYFDYYSYLDQALLKEDKEDELFDHKEESVAHDLNSLSKEKIKLVLTKENDLIVPDQSNRIGLNVIEHATDNDFYVTSFYKNGRYMWKRVYFRIENNDQLSFEL